MDFERFKKINDDRLNYKEMEDATIISSYRNTGCGDGYRIYLKIDENVDVAENEKNPKNKILDASYTTTGCGFGLVSLAVATEWVKGKTVEEANNINVETLEKEFEFPPRRKNYPESAVECIKKAISDYLNNTGIDPKKNVSAKSALELLKKNGNLRKADLRQVIFEKVDFTGIDFSNADLSHAYLTHCNFTNANLSNAKFRGAFLNFANLTNANLSDADLRFAKLTGANLENTKLDGALYDIGTRLDPRHTHLFSIMKKAKGLELQLHA